MNNEIQQNENKEINKEAETMDIIDWIYYMENSDKSFFDSDEFKQKFSLTSIIKEVKNIQALKEKYEAKCRENYEKNNIKMSDDVIMQDVEENINEVIRNEMGALNGILKGLFCNAIGVDKTISMPSLSKNSVGGIDIVTKTFLFTLLSQPRKKGSFVSKIKNKQFDKIAIEEITDFNEQLYNNLKKISNSKEWHAEIEVFKFEVNMLNGEIDRIKKDFEVAEKELISSVNNKLKEAFKILLKHEVVWNLIIPREFVKQRSVNNDFDSMIQYFLSYDNDSCCLDDYKELAKVAELNDNIIAVIDEWNKKYG